MDFISLSVIHVIRKWDEQHIHGHWQRSAPDIKKKSTLVFSTKNLTYLSDVLQTGSNIPYYKLFWSIMDKMQCFPGKQNMSGDIVLRQQSGYLGPKVERNTFLCVKQCKKKLNDLLCFHLPLTLNTKTRTTGSG